MTTRTEDDGKHGEEGGGQGEKGVVCTTNVVQQGHRIASHRIASHRIASHRIASRNPVKGHAPS